MIWIYGFYVGASLAVMWFAYRWGYEKGLVEGAAASYARERGV